VTAANAVSLASRLYHDTISEISDNNIDLDVQLEQEEEEEEKTE